VNLQIFVDKNQIGSIGNDQGKTFSIPSGIHQICIKLWTGKASPTLNIDVIDGTSIFLTCGIDKKGKLFLDKEESQISNNITGQAVDTILVSQIQNNLNLKIKIQQDINWFFWIGILSIINSVIHFLGGSLTFTLSLGTTQIIDSGVAAYTKDLSGKDKTIALLVGFIINLVIAGIFIVAGYFGQKSYRWIIIAGMTLYALDGIIFLVVGSWLEVGFHSLALWYLWRGIRTVNELNSLEAVEGNVME
jgi:hypothetical protein